MRGDRRRHYHADSQILKRVRRVKCSVCGDGIGRPMRCNCLARALQRSAMGAGTLGPATTASPHERLATPPPRPTHHLVYEAGRKRHASRKRHNTKSMSMMQRPASTSALGLATLATTSTASPWTIYSAPTHLVQDFEILTRPFFRWFSSHDILCKSLLDYGCLL